MQQNSDRNDSSSRAVSIDLMKGLAAGAAAVWLMDRVDWFLFNHESSASRARTEWARPDGMDPAHVAARKAARPFGTDLAPGRLHPMGIGIHYSLGMVPGALYGALRPQMPAIGKGGGLLYGFALFLAQDEVINTVTGLAGSPQEYPWQAHARGLIAHLVYGAALDAGLGLLNRGARASALPYPV